MGHQNNLTLTFKDWKFRTLELWQASLIQKAFGATELPVTAFKVIAKVGKTTFSYWSLPKYKTRENAQRERASYLVCTRLWRKKKEQNSESVPLIHNLKFSEYTLFNLLVTNQLTLDECDDYEPLSLGRSIKTIVIGSLVLLTLLKIYMKLNYLNI